MQHSLPGLIALLGSGETSPTMGLVYESLAQRAATPLQIALVETPAGFQPNSARVAGKVAEFLSGRLQNYAPQIELAPARRRGTPESPDAPEASRAVCGAGMIFLGPGSPTYTAQQLRGSLAWDRVVARNRQGAGLVLASAATLAVSRHVLPVYEIYKVGADLHWQPGLDLFAPYGLSLTLIPHWNNAEGGAELDTSRCFMGQARFSQLLTLLPEETTVLGIDEHTGVVIDLAEQTARVLGRGGVTIIRAGTEQRFERGSSFPLSALGDLQRPDLASGIPHAVWEETAPVAEPEPEPSEIPGAVIALVEARQAARASRDWGMADQIRQQLAALGWTVRDTPAGPSVEPVPR
jgi:hypothetical protein